MKRFSLFSMVGLFWALSYNSPCYAVDQLYLGGQFGYVALTGDHSNNFSNNIGFGGDLGLSSGGLIDLVLSFQTSSLSAMNLYAVPVSADVHVARFDDFDVTLGAGPGLYIWKLAGNSETKFGLHFGGAIDLIIDDHIKVGVASRYHAVFGGDPVAGSYATVGARVGYLFDL